jgi:hypothetical protein
MIVYGDPQFTLTAAAFISELRQELACARPESLDDIRSLLIRTGQLEQGLVDLIEREPLASLEPIQAATDCAAGAFCSAFGHPGTESVERVTTRLREFAAILALLAAGELAPRRLTIKVPEGFAFYALYPEQYWVAAEKWAQQIGNDNRRACIIGIRSIGTTLSAVVAETLRCHGWSAHRFTVRPQGPPFERTAVMGRSQVAGADFALVVDEGPGLSGSSMASVAEALTATGFSTERIFFFPAHDAGPGPAASPAGRRWWSTVPQCVTGADELRWRGASLAEMLRARTRERFGEVRSVHDVCSGGWRRFAYRDEAEWPAALSRFERAKYLVELGDGRRVLWKFSGVHAPPQALPTFSATNTPARSVETLQYVDFFHGFAAMPWVEGNRLRASHADEEMVHALSHYVSAAATEPLDRTERVAAVGRLADMLFWNTKESLGSEAAEVACELCGSVRVLLGEAEMRSYGDGRLAPCEFVRARTGTVFKTDNSGHVCDHTIVGKQSVLWDAAGAMVEWGLNERHAVALMRELQCVDALLPDAIRQFYCAAYAAFGLGMASMCASTADESERPRLQRAADFYRSSLSRSLQLVPAAHS